MPYHHNFTVLEVSKYDPANIHAWPKQYQLSIHGDIIEYMWDSLNWLPTDFAHNKSIGKRTGLDLTGVCVLWADGTLLLGKLCRLYAGIFELGPDTLTLTNGHIYETCSEVDGMIPISAFKRSKTAFDRNLILNQLRKLAEMCDFVAEQNNTHYLAHRGL